MKFYLIILIVSLSATSFSCSEPPPNDSKNTTRTVAESDREERNVEAEKQPESKAEVFDSAMHGRELETDFRNWWSYHTYYISLSSNFVPLNFDSDTISKKKFLERLSSGKYIPLEIPSYRETSTYRLYKLTAKADKSIAQTIRSESLKSLHYLNLEGQLLPNFEFVDLEGNTYDHENTKGKMLVIKTWFIRCAACVAEFPELNELVEKYAKVDDIAFISLALDEESDLRQFIENKPFAYKVIPYQKKFIERLGLQVYPTHLVVDRDGRILRVGNKASEMIAFLEHQLSR